MKFETFLNLIKYPIKSNPFFIKLKKKTISLRQHSKSEIKNNTIERKEESACWSASIRDERAVDFAPGSKYRSATTVTTSNSKLQLCIAEAATTVQFTKSKKGEGGEPRSFVYATILIQVLCV